MSEDLDDFMDRDEPDECRCGCPNCNSGNHAYCPMQCDGGGTPDVVECDHCNRPATKKWGDEKVCDYCFGEMKAEAEREADIPDEFAEWGPTPAPKQKPWLDGTYSKLLEAYDAD